MHNKTKNHLLHNPLSNITNSSVSQFNTMIYLIIYMSNVFDDLFNKPSSSHLKN